MIPIIDNWVLISDENNYTIARYLGKKVDKKGNVQNILKCSKCHHETITHESDPWEKF